jgi:hypothetical protein
MKTLVSWVAQNNDFENGEVFETGPTSNFHKYFFKGDRHFILSTKKGDDTRTEKLVKSFSFFSQLKRRSNCAFYFTWHSSNASCLVLVSYEYEFKYYALPNKGSEAYGYKR